MMLTVALSAVVLAQPGADRPPTARRGGVQITSHVVRPGDVPATPERLAQLGLPAGFLVNTFAEGLGKIRMFAVADDGTLYATRREEGDLLMIRDGDGDGRAEIVETVAEEPELHGVAVRGDKIYLATVKEVFMADLDEDGTVGELEPIIEDLPDGGQHPNRTLAFGPDDMLYISVGSTCNACAETNPESATILRARPNGSGRQVFASGLRNTIGFGWHPETQAMYGFDHGIDWLGDDEQKEEFNRIERGKKYGWPYVYADGEFNPANEPPGGKTREEWAAESEEPVLLYTAHAAPMQMVFYTGEQFPEEYRGAAFGAMHGSWNRSPPSGYEVVVVRFDRQGEPESVEPFLTGFLAGSGRDGWSRFARPCGMAVAKDGSLLIGDDMNGAIYRVTYER